MKQAGLEAPKTPDASCRSQDHQGQGIATYPIALPLSATEGSATAWYLLTKAFGGELFDKDFKPLFTNRIRPASRR